MKFKQYLAEMESDQEVENMPSLDGNIIDEVNSQLETELQETILSPESGIQKIRKVLGMFDMDMPALYDVNPEGEEMVFGIEGSYLYIIYALTDDGRYDFYAELTDEEGLSEILSDEGEDEEEE
jgi:hypothetical protein